MSHEIEPIKLGVRFNPPCLIFQYKLKGSVKKRTMPIRDLKKSTDCYQFAQKFKKRHEKQLGDIATVRIEKFLRLLQITMSGKSLQEAVKVVECEFTISHLEDMNKLTDQQLARRKELMDINFEKNRVKFGDPDYVYDKQVSRVNQLYYFFGLVSWSFLLQVDFSNVDKVESGWDNETEGGAAAEEDDFW